MDCDIYLLCYLDVYIEKVVKIKVMLFELKQILVCIQMVILDMINQHAESVKKRNIVLE